MSGHTDQSDEVAVSEVNIMKLTLNLKKSLGLTFSSGLTCSPPARTVSLHSRRSLMDAEPLVTIWTSERAGCWWSHDPQETQTVNIIIEATKQKTEPQ